MGKLIKKMKEQIKKTGERRKNIFYLSDGKKKRVRFLDDLEDAIEVPFHDKWGELQPLPCLKIYGKKCGFCKIEDVRTKTNYIWNVYDYKDGKTSLFMFKAHEITPIPKLIAMYENYGTLLDRDYVVSRSGERFDTSYQVVPLDKKKFAKKTKKFTRQAILKILWLAHNVEAQMEDLGSVGDDEEELDIEEEEAEDLEDLEDSEESEEEGDLEDSDDDLEIEDEEDEPEEPKKTRKKKGKKKKRSYEDEDPF